MKGSWGGLLIAVGIAALSSVTSTSARSDADHDESPVAAASLAATDVADPLRAALTGVSPTVAPTLGPAPIEVPVDASTDAIEFIPSVPDLAAPVAAPVPTISPTPMVPVDEVYWTVEFTESLDSVAGRWGLKRKHLMGLNPQVPRRKKVQAGTRLRVYVRSEQSPTLSIGSPNKGRLNHGMPLPEGPHWTLRERRPRTYGASNAVTALVAAFTTYGRTFDDPPPVSVGELSARRGGRALPHRSHRTGRDVDLGYILTQDHDNTRWTRADESNFDVEKNWALIEALVATGEVQQIFISNRLQRLLRPHAKARLSATEFGRYFRTADQDRRHVPILKHWDGHRDHMHVRFFCERENRRCRSRAPRSKRSNAS